MKSSFTQKRVHTGKTVTHLLQFPCKQKTPQTDLIRHTFSFTQLLLINNSQAVTTHFAAYFLFVLIKRFENICWSVFSLIFFIFWANILLAWFWFHYVVTHLLLCEFLLCPFSAQSNALQFPSVVTISVNVLKLSPTKWGYLCNLKILL